MSGSDNVLINTREKAVSADINDLQSMIHRAAADTFKYLFQMDLANLNTARDVVLGGLQVVPNGNNVDVQPGVLMQKDSTLAPVPGSLDSDYRVAFNRSNLAVTMPAPGSDTFYLIEVQMEDVVLFSTSRRVLNVSTGNFDATSVNKQLERRVKAQVLTGTTSAPAPSGAPWVPIAIVRRPAGGGAVLFSDIHDIRNMASETFHRANRNAAVSAGTGLITDGQATQVTSPDSGGAQNFNLQNPSFDVHFPGNGVNPTLFASWGGSGNVDLSDAGIIEPGVTIAANTWYYLYLCKWRSAYLPEAGNRTTNVSGRGVAVLTNKAPNAQGELHTLASNISNLPAPFSAGAVTADDDVVCIGAFRSNTLATGFLPCWTTDGRRWHFYEALTPNSSAIAITTSGNATLAFTDLPVPVNARKIYFRAAVGLTTAMVGDFAGWRVRFRPTGTTNFYVQTATTGDQFQHTEEVEWDVARLGKLIDAHFITTLYGPSTPTAATGTTSVTLNLTGWEV